MTSATINLIWDTSVTTSAPAGFMAAVQAAATYLDSIITNPITLNIEVGWNEITQGTVTTPISAGVSEGGPDAGAYVPMATLLATLNSKATSAAQLQAWSTISPTLNPNGNGEVALTSAQLDALGLSSYLGGTPAVDGSIGIGSAFPASSWEAAALHEITHALGRISGYAPYGLQDLFRYSAPGVHVYAGGVAGQYFSIDGGKTDLADYAPTSDYGDWASTGTTALDPFAWVVQNGTNGTQISAVDKTILNVIGFNIAGTVLNYTVAQAIAAFAANANTAALTVVDTAQNVTNGLNQLQALAAAAKIASITLSDAPNTVHATVTQLTSDSATLATIAAPFSLTVDNGATAFTHTMLANEINETATGNGAATITGNALVDTIVGGTGNDTLIAGSGNNYLIGGAGNDTIYVGQGAEYVNGGAGVNTVSFATLTKGVTFNMAYNSAIAGNGAGDYITNCQAVIGTNFGDTLIGDNNQDWLIGGSGTNTIIAGSANDFLVAGSGANYLIGGAGSDTIYVGQGADYVDGGAGVNTVSFATLTKGVTFNMAYNSAIAGNGAGDYIINCQVVIGTDFADTLIGDSKLDRLMGGAGNDTLIAGSGSDFLSGGIGNNTFEFTSATLGIDEISDFKIGSDNVHIAAALVPNFGSLVMTQSGANTIITVGAGSIQLDNILVANLTASSFTFS